MANANVLKEFLVKLGFSTDEQSYKKFVAKSEAITKQFLELGKVAAVAGTVVAGAVLKIASDMEQLYFSSERAGTSVKNLMALRFGGAQAGVGADAMASAVEQMASTIRSNPGMVALGLGEKRMKTSKVIALVALLGMAAAIASWSQGPPANPSLGSILPNYAFPVMTFTATGQTKTQNVGGISIATVRIAGPATVATLQIKASNDAGANYFAIPFTNGTYTSSVLQVTTPGAFPAYSGTPVLYWVNLAGFTSVTVTTSGTFTGASVSVQITGSSNSGTGLI